eukprot:1142761-Amphidinium_carterae.1
MDTCLRACAGTRAFSCQPGRSAQHNRWAQRARHRTYQGRCACASLASSDGHQASSSSSSGFQANTVAAMQLSRRWALLQHEHRFEQLRWEAQD